MRKNIVKRINFTEQFDNLLNVWCACFPDDADFGETFLKNIAPCADIFGVFTDETLVSCAYFFKTTFFERNAQFSAYYVYGVGTLPSFRGQGLAKSVLEYAAAMLSCDLLFLYPAKPSLRMFYEQLGYLSILYRCEPIATTCGGEKLTLKETSFSVKDYEKIRTAFLNKNTVSYASFDSAVYATLLQHAFVLTFDDGAALCIAEDQTVYLPEILCESALVDAVLAAVKQRFSDKHVVAYVPGQEKESGMLLPCSVRAKAYFKKQMKIPFFGTFFAE